MRSQVRADLSLILRKGTRETNMYSTNWKRFLTSLCFCLSCIVYPLVIICETLKKKKNLHLWRQERGKIEEIRSTGKYAEEQQLKERTKGRNTRVPGLRQRAGAGVGWWTGSLDWCRNPSRFLPGPCSDNRMERTARRSLCCGGRHKCV